MIAVCVVEGELIIDHDPVGWSTCMVWHFLGHSSETTCVFDK